MDISIRLFKPGDIDFAVTQTGREGWDATAELFEVCLAHDPDGCLVAEADRRPVGMITTTRYRQTAWLGNLIVLPSCRSQGIGRRLMNHALDYLTNAGVQTVRLEADPPGVKLYRSLGFVDEFDSLRFKCPPAAATIPAEVEPITPENLEEVGVFDREHFGDERGRLLQLLLSHGGCGYVLRAGAPPLPGAGDRCLQGYGLLVPSTVGVRLGPWVASDRETAELLLHALCADAGDRTVILGVPCLNDAALELLIATGFERCGSCLRMVRGPRIAAGAPEHIFAIANGAMG